MQKTSLFVISMVALSLVGAGCNPFQSAQDRAAESAIERASGGRVKVDSSGKQMDITGEDGTSMRVGEDIKLPDNFPKDVPVYPGAKIAAVSVSTSGDKSALMNIRSTDEVGKVVQWYADTMKKSGFKESQTMDIGESKFKTFENGNITITCIFVAEQSKDASGTTVSLTRSEK
jgi:hypothetical protein